MRLSPKPDAAAPKGRAALSNETNRFESLARVPVSDGWDLPADASVWRTEVREERIERIISLNQSPDLPFRQSVNPYRGCEHGCIYCFARPSHAYLGLSPGLDFETQLLARPNAAQALERALGKRGYVPDVIAVGTNTDAYQPIERDRRIMREILEVLAACDHPVAIVTKGSLIERDIDILGPMAAKGLARVGISVTTLERDVARAMEPRVPPPARRLQTIKRLSAAGIPVRVMMSPVIPGLTDHEMEEVLRAGRDAGAVGASSIMLRLPREVAPLFRAWVEAAFPARATKIMARVREMHGGKDYDARFGHRMRGAGVHAELLHKRFARAVRALGLDTDLPPLRTDLFRKPGQYGDQMSLF